MGFFDDPANQPPSTIPSSGGGQTVTGTFSPTGQPTVASPTQPAASTTPSGAQPTITNPNDPGQVTAYFQWLATQPNTDPILQTPGGVQYYVQKALESGGLTSPDYWKTKATLYSAGGGVGAPSNGAGGMGAGSLWNTLPTEQEAENMPGFKFAIDEANRGLQAGAAAKGTLLNGRVQQGIGESLVGTALSQGYIPLAQLKLGYNQANEGNLYSLANLGLNATSVGSQ